MRLVALLLALANVAFYAWAAHLSEARSPESHLVQHQIKPESIRLLSPVEVSKLAGRGDGGGGPASSCVEWGAFNPADVARAHAALEPLAAPAKIVERRAEDAAGWWVFMPPQPTRQAVQQKVGELKRLGVEDYFVVQDDPKLRFAISLGVFRTEEAARTRLEELRGRGVKTAQLGPRGTPALRIYLQVREGPEGLQPKLAGLKEDFPSAELRECEAASR